MEIMSVSLVSFKDTVRLHTHTHTHTHTTHTYTRTHTRTHTHTDARTRTYTHTHSGSKLLEFETWTKRRIFSRNPPLYGTQVLLLRLTILPGQINSAVTSQLYLYTQIVFHRSNVFIASHKLGAIWVGLCWISEILAPTGNWTTTTQSSHYSDRAASAHY